MGYEPGMGKAFLMVLLFIGLFGVWNMWLKQFAEYILQSLFGTDDYESRNPAYE